MLNPLTRERKSKEYNINYCSNVYIQYYSNVHTEKIPSDKTHTHFKGTRQSSRPNLIHIFPSIWNSWIESYKVEE